MAQSESRILAFSGSAREGSYNQKLVSLAAKCAASIGAQTTVVNLRDYPLPIFDEDLERKGRPENLQALCDLFHDHDGLLISSPEYNSSITPLLKNVIDWVSRGDSERPPLSAYHGKVAGIMAASPGGLGGIRGLVHLRAILGNIGVLVVPKQIAVSKAYEAFDEEGNLTDAKLHESVMDIVTSMDTVIRAIS